MRAIFTKYLGATEKRGSRIMATDEERHRVFIPYDNEFHDTALHRLAARTLCKKMKWKGRIVGGHTKKGMVWVFVS